MDQKKDPLYDKEVAKIFADPFLYGVQIHMENIEKETNTVEIKKEYILGLETILTKQDISTAPSILPEIGKCVDLINIKGVEADMCVMLGHISQNVIPVAEQLIKSKVYSKCLSMHKNVPMAINKIIFLFTILNNTLPSLRDALIDANEDIQQIFSISEDDPHLEQKSKPRLAAIKNSFQTPK